MQSPSLVEPSFTGCTIHLSTFFGIFWFYAFIAFCEELILTLLLSSCFKFLLNISLLIFKGFGFLNLAWFIDKQVQTNMAYHFVMVVALAIFAFVTKGSCICIFLGSFRDSGCCHIMCEQLPRTCIDQRINKTYSNRLSRLPSCN